jgi:hypothetical protein
MIQDDGIDAEVAISQLLDVPEYRPNIVAVLSTAARTHLIRGETRLAEREAAVQLHKQNLPSAKSALLARTFPAADGRMVEWTKASASDHRSRAFWFRERATSFNNTASLHELAARLIEEAEVSCLDEIESIEHWPELAATALPVEATKATKPMNKVLSRGKK